MRRVVFVERDYGNVGGSLRSLYLLLSHMDARFERWVTFAADQDNPMRSAFERAGCQVIELRRGWDLPESFAGRSGLARGLLRIRGAVSWLWAILVHDTRRCIQLAREIRRHRIELVYMNPGIIGYAAVAAILTGVPIVSHHRSIRRLRAPGRLLTRFVSVSICNSHFVERQTRRWSRCGDFRVVHNGIELPESPRTPIVPGARVGCVGRLVEWKGQHVLIEAAPAVLRQVPQARFEFVGGSVGAENAAYEAHLRRRVVELGLEHAVVFAGHVADVDRLYREAFDVVVHTSVQGEPFGLVLIEAMAAGVPVVASDGGACAEIIEHGRSGILVPPGDPEALAKALIALLEDAPARERLAANAFERVREHFGIGTVVERVSGVIDEVLEAR